MGAEFKEGAVRLVLDKDHVAVTKVEAAAPRAPFMRLDVIVENVAPASPTSLTVL
ncbi:MAG: hypothetical protein K1X64_04250 [Myxococcaceae bacterium]|nr:hypothetical protein [Myxococcaceae bacterium]